MEDQVTSKDQLAEWFDEGVTRKADYMIIVRDMFEKSVEPVYVKLGGEKSVHELAQGYENDEKMTRVLEVYDLHGDRDAQVDEHRTWAIPRPTPSATTALVEKLTEILTTPESGSVSKTVLMAMLMEGVPAPPDEDDDVNVLLN